MAISLDKVIAELKIDPAAKVSALDADGILGAVGNIKDVDKTSLDSIKNSIRRAAEAFSKTEEKLPAFLREKAGGIVISELLANILPVLAAQNADANQASSKGKQKGEDGLPPKLSNEDKTKIIDEMEMDEEGKKRKGVSSTTSEANKKKRDDNPDKAGHIAKGSGKSANWSQQALDPMRSMKKDPERVDGGKSGAASSLGQRIGKAGMRTIECNNILDMSEKFQLTGKDGLLFDAVANRIGGTFEQVRE